MLPHPHLPNAHAHVVTMRPARTSVSDIDAPNLLPAAWPVLVSRPVCRRQEWWSRADVAELRAFSIGAPQASRR